jgi:hypothetical protein
MMGNLPKKNAGFAAGSYLLTSTRVTYRNAKTFLLRWGFVLGNVGQDSFAAQEL